MKKFEFTGVDMSIDVYEDKVEIKPKKSLLGLLGGQGSETIPMKNITSVEVRECSFVNGGHLMISAIGVSSKENKIQFGGFSGRDEMNKNANAIKAFIVEKMGEISQPTSDSNMSEELTKLAALKANGILSEEEFTQAKNKLLGL
jgi:hypothetical protein